MKRSRELICPKCGNSIYIYDKETFCYCKNCKKDYQVIKEYDEFSLSPVETKDKSVKSKNNNYLYVILIIFINLLLLFYAYTNGFFDNYINNNNNNHGDVPISNK